MTKTPAKQFVLAALVLGYCSLSAAQAIYKCTGSGGITMQQTPCVGQGERLQTSPSSGSTSMVPSSSQVDGADQPRRLLQAKSSAEKALEAAQSDRLRREKWYEMQRWRQQIETVAQACGREQRQISAERNYSRNNLAGATRDVSLTTEMNAAAQICDTRVKSAEREADRAIAECDRIKCIAPYN